MDGPFSEDKFGVRVQKIVAKSGPAVRQILRFVYPKGRRMTSGFEAYEGRIFLGSKQCQDQERTRHSNPWYILSLECFRIRGDLVRSVVGKDTPS